jgi:4-hydroxy-tetrahydrodipicolinate reductase
MGHAAAEAIVRAGLPLVPYTLTGYSAGVAVGGVGVAGIPVEVVGKASRQEAMDRVREQYGGAGSAAAAAAGGAAAAAATATSSTAAAAAAAAAGAITTTDDAASAGRLVVVDYTTPAAALDNARFYARNGVPFVMGTTGADAELVARAAEEAGVPALVAPQMGKQVVALQAALRMAADAFPGAFGGYELDAVESHQASKVDVSGTAREVVRSLRALGGRFADEQQQEDGQAEGQGSSTSTSNNDDPAWHVRRVRDRATQQSPAIGVPYDALGGHAYHTYTLSSPGAPPLPPLLAASSGGGGAPSSSSSSSSRRAVAAGERQQGPAPTSPPDTATAASVDNPDAGSWSRFVFKHNVVGREGYARGTADAVLFLAAAARAAARRRRQAAAGGGGADAAAAASTAGRRVFDMVDVLRAGDLRARAARARAARDASSSSSAPSASSSASTTTTTTTAKARRANSPSVAAAAAASAAATRTAKEERAKAKAAAGELDG